MNKKLLIGIVGAVLVVAVGGIAYFVVVRMNQPAEPTQTVKLTPELQEKVRQDVDSTHDAFMEKFGPHK